MKRYLTSLLVVVTAVALFAFSGASLAANNPGSSSLSYVPRKNLIVKPGSTVKDKLSLTNVSDTATLNIAIRIIDFTSYNQTGTPKLFLEKDAPQTTWSLKPFLTTPKQVIIPPGQSRTIHYSVHIPKGHGAGSYYSAILYTTGGGAGGNVNLSASGTTLVFVTVPGKVKENLELKKLGSYQSSDPAGAHGKITHINLTEPFRMGMLLKNHGNVTESPHGSIVVRNFWGNKVIKIDDVNVNSDLALINQKRLFLTCFINKPKEEQKHSKDSKTGNCEEPHLTPGRYTAQLDVFYGQNGNPTKEIKATAVFWYIPWWIIVIAVVVLLMIVRTILKVRRKVNDMKSSGKYRLKRKHKHRP